MLDLGHGAPPAGATRADDDDKSTNKTQYIFTLMCGNERGAVAATAATSSAEINLEKLMDAFATYTANADVFQLAVYADRIRTN